MKKNARIEKDLKKLGEMGFSKAQTDEAKVRYFARQVDSGRNHLISIPEIRKMSGMNKNDFDAAVLRMAEKGKIWLHHHVHSSVLSADELDSMVKNGASYAMGIVFR